ncbi:hypothetical protein [Streptomyces sp. NPDC002104]
MTSAGTGARAAYAAFVGWLVNLAQVRTDLGDGYGVIDFLDAVPVTARRDRGVYLARHATAAAVAREPEQAVEIARAAVEIATETRSARMLHELRSLEGEMRPWHDAPVGRDLVEVLAPVTEGS